MVSGHTAGGIDGQSVQLRQNQFHRICGGLLAHCGEAHSDRLLRVDGDGVEHNFVRATLHIEQIQQIFHADVMRGQRWRIVAREARRGAGDGANRVAVGGRVDHDDAIGALAAAPAE